MPNHKPVVVGLTGQTGAGKTTISEAFAKYGYAIINCDLVAREVTSDLTLVKRLGELFGGDVVNPDGTLNRRQLAAKVFSDQNELLKYNTILHPLILKRIEEEMNRLSESGRRYILLDAPTLFESGADKLCKKTVAVLADRGLRKQRIMERDGLTPEEAETRISAQQPDAFYKNKADYTLVNNGSADRLFIGGEQIVKRLEKTNPIKSVWKAILGFLLCLLFIGGVYFVFFWNQYPKKYEEFVSRYAAEYQVDPALVYAVIKCESSFRPEAVSPVGARGLTQITEETFDWAKMGLKDDAVYDDLFEPETSIQYGTYLLSRFLREFETERSALAAYHAGWGKVKSWLADAAYSEDGVNLDMIPGQATDRYVDKVEAAKKVYDNLYHFEESK